MNAVSVKLTTLTLFLKISILVPSNSRKSLLAALIVIAPLASEIASTLFSLMVIPLSLIVTLSVELPMTLVAAKVACVVLAVFISKESESILTCCPDVGPIVVVVPNDADTSVPLRISTLPSESISTLL